MCKHMTSFGNPLKRHQYEDYPSIFFILRLFRETGRSRKVPGRTPEAEYGSINSYTGSRKRPEGFRKQPGSNLHFASSSSFLSSVLNMNFNIYIILILTLKYTYIIYTYIICGTPPSDPPFSRFFKNTKGGSTHLT